MYTDSQGHYPTPISWFNASNIFNLTSTICQLGINGALIYSYFRIANAVRPANIGLGIWNKGQAACLKSFKDVDVPKLNKASNILAGVTVGMQVVAGVVTDYNRGYSTDRIVSNAVVNIGIYAGTTFGYVYLGGLFGSLIPIPIVGTAIGTAAGFVIGLGVDFFLEWEINGKSVIDHIRDGVYDFRNNIFD